MSNPAPDFDCDGKIAIAVFQNGRVEFSLRHECVHATRENYEVSDAVKKFIEEHRDLPSAALVTYQLRLEHRKGNFPEMSHIKPGQVYYHWSQIQTERFKRHDDPLQSTLLLLKEQNEEIICRPSSDYDCVGILTPIFNNVMSAPGRSNDVYFDSTCKYGNYNSM